MFSPEFNLEGELWNTSVLSSHNLIKTQNLIICRQVREEIKGIDICYIKETPYNNNKAEAYYLHVHASEYSYTSYFLSNYLRI